MKYLTIIVLMLPLLAHGTTNEFIVDGNSLSVLPNYVDAWPGQLQLPANCGRTNIAVSGNDSDQQIALMQANLTPNLDAACTRRVEHWLEIGNMIAHGHTAIEAANSYSNYCIFAKTNVNPPLIVGGTCWSRGDLVGDDEEKRLTANNIVRNNHLYLDRFIDYDTDDRLNYLTHPENFTGSPLIHLSSSGITVVTNINMDIILSMLSTNNFSPAPFR